MYPDVSQVLLRFYLKMIDIITHKNKLNVNDNAQSSCPSSRSHSPKKTSEVKNTYYLGLLPTSYTCISSPSSDTIRSQIKEFW